MSWVDDARNEGDRVAQQQAQKTEKQTNIASSAHNRDLQVFEEITSKVKRDLDVVFAELRSRGVFVSEPEYGYFYRTPSTGNMWTKLDGSADMEGGSSWDLSYSIRWEAREASYGKSICVFVGVNRSFHWETNIWGTKRRKVWDFSPSNNAKNIKDQLRKWLTKVHSDRS